MIIFEEILKTMMETKFQNNEIENGITSLVKVVSNIGESFEEVALSADQLTVITQKMHWSYLINRSQDAL